MIVPDNVCFFVNSTSSWRYWVWKCTLTLEVTCCLTQKWMPSASFSMPSLMTSHRTRVAGTSQEPLWWTKSHALSSVPERVLSPQRQEAVPLCRQMGRGSRPCLKSVQFWRNWMSPMWSLKETSSRSLLTSSAGVCACGGGGGGVHACLIACVHAYVGMYTRNMYLCAHLAMLMCARKYRSAYAKMWGGVWWHLTVVLIGWVMTLMMVSVSHGACFHGIFSAVLCSHSVPAFRK